MDELRPVYTVLAECQDCYKCLRQCPVKAIRIQDGHAAVVPDMCISCGSCVKVCPAGAKKIRDDLDRARRLVETREKVFVSLAPSFRSEFADLDAPKLIHAIRRLGFQGVSETALGAQEVSAHVAERLSSRVPEVLLSSACPTVVELVKKYRPEWGGATLDMLSPMLAHSRLLRRHCGPEIGVVFVGPCIAKKLESDRHADLVNVALTFDELKLWWRLAGIEPAAAEAGPEDRFVPESAGEGALYPIDGGMVAGLKAQCHVTDANFMAFSGVGNVLDALADLETASHERSLFLEMLACEGGCVNGPCVTKRNGTALKRCRIIESANVPAQPFPRRPALDLFYRLDLPPVRRAEYSEAEIAQALERVGKFGREDEINCGGCGYDSCREFARALLDRRAETNMCVGYMRQLASKKANALIRTMPAGVVIVDDHLRVVESNRRFAEFLGERALTAYEASAGMEGACLDRLAPFHHLFAQVLGEGTERMERDVRLGEAVLNVSVFTIEPNRLVGGIVQDITEPAVRKERIVQQARKVISRNLETVQQIAYLLGENAAESEVILNRIVESFGKDAGEEPPAREEDKP